ncbi:MAG: YCF48-related protein [Saprospiraceae bacterium]|nr:YCF48-related protein [Saprospiraceae bacterium]
MKKTILFINLLIFLLFACKKPAEEIILIEDFRTRCVKAIENPKLEGWDLTELFIEINGSKEHQHASDLFFISNETGYVIADRRLIKTENAGATWNIVPLSIGGSLERYSEVFFLNKSLGWVLSYHGENCENSSCDIVPTIWKTNDAGASWSAIKPKVEGIIGNLYMINELNGFCLIASSKTGRKLLRTNDGGASWTEIPGVKPSPYHFRIRFTDKNIGFILGDNDILYKTSDGGDTWQELHHSLEEAHNIIFIDNNIGYITDAISIVKTEDGGQNWQTIYTNESLIRLVHFRNQDEGIAFINTPQVCDDGTIDYFSNISMTENGGTDWELDPFGIEPYAIITSVPSADICYMLSSEGLFRFIKK